MAWAEAGRPVRQAASGSELLAGHAGSAVKTAAGDAVPAHAGVLGTDLLNPLWSEVRLPARAQAAAGKLRASSRAAGDVVLYHCRSYGVVSLQRPEPLTMPPGGLLADEMGLGGLPVAAMMHAL